MLTGMMSLAVTINSSVMRYAKVIETAHVLGDRLPDEASGIQVGPGLGECGLELAFPKVLVMRTAHDHVLHLAAHGHAGVGLALKGLVDGANALGLEVIG